MHPTTWTKMMNLQMIPAFPSPATRRLFAGDKMADVLVCLKRSVVLLVGQHALYLRLPDQDPAAKVHRIKVDALHKALLAEKDKPLYSKYKLGIVEYGPHWEEETQREVRGGMEKFAAGRPEVYIKYMPMMKLSPSCTQPFLQSIFLTDTENLLEMKSRLCSYLRLSSSQTQL
jgi:hypothetical protein